MNSQASRAGNSLWSRLFLCYWLLIVVAWAWTLDIYGPVSYISFAVSDWLINYEGGFVRRGLDGQLLFWLCRHVPVPPIHLLKSIVGVSSVCLVMLVLRVFSRRGWSLSILPFCFCLSIAFNMDARRDAMLLVAAYLLFVCYRRLLSGRGWWWHVGFGLLSVLMLLSHEASFFFTIPLLMVYGWVGRPAGRRGASAVLRWLAPFVPALVAMAAVCLCKGSADVAQTIWGSWDEWFRRYPDGVYSYAITHRRLGYGVEALSWPAAGTMGMHAAYNFLGQYPVERFSVFSLLETPVYLWLFVSAFYLVTRINSVSVAFYPLASTDQSRRIGTVLLVQLVFMLPMFTVLSVDCWRTMAYWVLSSLFALDVFGDLSVGPVSRLSDRVQTFIERRRLATPAVFLLVALLTPFMRWGGTSYLSLLPFRALKVLLGL